MLTRAESERGAVAIIVSMLAVVLFASGALAVDLGNMWSRRRMAQSAADLAALAGAAQLPDASAAVQTAYDYLATHDPVAEGSFTETELTDGILANGEITVNSTKNTISVDLAPRRVDFGLAAAMGYSNGTVSAHAVAALRSPSKLLPFFLPIDCSNGPEILKEGPQSTGPVTEPSPVYQTTPTGSGNPQPTVDSVTPSTGAEGTVISSLAIEGNQFQPTGMLVDFTRGPVVHTVNSGTVVMGNGNHGTLTLAPVPSGVTSTAGIWYVRVWTTKGWSAPATLAIAAAGPPAPTSCGQKSTGDFGMLDSPRRDVNGNQNQLDRNIALGLDHGVVQFTGTLPSKTEKDNCTDHANTPIAGGVFDDDPMIDTANCMDINNGNKVDAATDGLILGGAGFSGRLTGAASKSCAGASGGANPITFMNRQINNDTIDCYLLPGHTVAELSDKNLATAILDPSIVNSPRFFFVPAIHYGYNPPNGFYPIVVMRGVFITDQTAVTAATASNGLATNAGGTKITQIQVLAFNIQAVPLGLADGGNGVTYFGSGPKVVRLIE
jgi:hypothetical protein